MIFSDLGLTIDDDHVMPDGDIWTLDSAGVAFVATDVALSLRGSCIEAAASWS